MPHRRAHIFLTSFAARVSAALQGPLPRWIFAPFAALPAANAYVYLSRDPLAFSSPAFDAAKQQAQPVAETVGVNPMQVWGVVSLICATVIAAGLVRYSTPWTVSGLLLAGTFYAYWGSLLIYQAITDPTVPPSGANFLAFISTIYMFALLVVAATWPFRPIEERRRLGGRLVGHVRSEVWRGGRE